LLLTGLAAAVAFRCGVWNIGAEGQFLIGAVTMVAFGTMLLLPGPGWLILPIVLILSAISGATWALLATGLERWRGVPVVLSTILLNFIAVAVVGMLVQGPLHDPATTAPQTAVIAEHLRLPVLADGTRLHLGVLIAAAIAVALWLALKRTTVGFEVQVVGLNPDAAHLMGMPVGARQVLVMAVSGGLAGFAGAAQVAGVTTMLSGSPTSYGYAGIAVAMLGRLHPLGIIAASLFLGMLSTGARNLERRLAIPHDAGDVVQGLLVLAILVGAGIAARRALRPRAEAA
jgi:simple sugar transport system permease protein